MDCRRSTPPALPALASTLLLVSMCLAEQPGRGDSTDKKPTKTASAVSPPVAAPATSPDALAAGQPFRANPSFAAQITSDPTPIVDGQYQMRMPDGYTLYKTQSDGSQSFGTERRADGSRSIIHIFSVPMPAGSAPRAQMLRTAAAQALNEQRGIWSGLTASTPQYGTIGGIAFARIYFKGIYENHTVHDVRALRGLEYICIDQKSCVHVIAEDTQEQGAATLPLAEAAVLTFMRSQTSNPPLEDSPPAQQE